MKKEVFYPPVGIVHVTSKISDLIKYRLNNQTKIIINTSAQPNSSPHLGTITTIMCAFALANKLREELNINVEVQFDELENSPSKIFEIKGDNYYKDQRHNISDDGVSYELINMKNFNEILNSISEFSNVRYSIRSYNEFQSNKYIRSTIIKIINDSAYFKCLLFPSSSEIHIRSICPKCGIGKKNVHSINEIHDSNEVNMKFNCPIHGDYSIVIKEENDDYIDINTQLRDLTKGAAMLEEDKDNNTLTIMLDGGDWSGMWAQRMHTEGLVRLGYDVFPIRFFAPVILDWSGAKFSKSLYLKSDAYKNINKAFINYDNFIDYYGVDGMKKLWNEVKNWMDDPKRFFRNYSVDYFQIVMESEENEK